MSHPICIALLSKTPVYNFLYLGDFVYIFLVKAVVIGGDYGWDSWTTWSECSASCDRGTQYRTRKCVEDTCVGEGKENKSCIIRHCGKHQYGDFKTN